MIARCQIEILHRNVRIARVGPEKIVGQHAADGTLVLRQEMRPIGDGVDLPEVAQVPAKRTDVSVGYYRSETDLALDAEAHVVRSQHLGMQFDSVSHRGRSEDC